MQQEQFDEVMHSALCYFRRVTVSACFEMRLEGLLCVFCSLSPNLLGRFLTALGRRFESGGKLLAKLQYGWLQSVQPDRANLTSDTFWLLPDVSMPSVLLLRRRIWPRSQMCVEYYEIAGF